MSKTTKKIIEKKNKKYEEENAEQELRDHVSGQDNYHEPGIDMQVEAYNENFPGDYEGLNPEELSKRFNAEIVMGIATFYFAEKYPNNQRLGREIRKIVNLLKK